MSCIGVALGGQAHDVMGYHTADEIPNYWAYASQFVLQDAMFAGERDYSYPSHLDLTSEWAANCTDNTNAMTCTTGNAGAGGVSAKTTQTAMVQPVPAARYAKRKLEILCRSRNRAGLSGWRRRLHAARAELQERLDLEPGAAVSLCQAAGKGLSQRSPVQFEPVCPGRAERQSRPGQLDHSLEQE